MRISDWSSDVGSSDLQPQGRMADGGRHAPDLPVASFADRQPQPAVRHALAEPDRDLKSLVEGKGLTLSVNFGCRRTIKKNNLTNSFIQDGHRLITDKHITQL